MNESNINIAAVGSDQPGAFKFHSIGTARNIWLYFNCPSGCGHLCSVPCVADPVPAPTDHVWTWNGDEEKPTLNMPVSAVSDCGFAGTLRDGQWTAAPESPALADDVFHA
jgi:hypothetical protein